MISYEIPLERYPDTYNGQPLLFAALANDPTIEKHTVLGAAKAPKGRRWDLLL